MPQSFSKMQRRIRRALAAAAAAAALALPDAWANNPLIEGPASLQDFVHASVPQWNFARANSNDPCWPQAAFDGNGNPAGGGDVQNWPNSDGGCAAHGSPFPTYYTVQKCGNNNDDIRVTFTIYLATSGFRPSGHRHDFEYTAVVWRRDGSEWRRRTWVGSSHGGVHVADWTKAESWNADRGSAGLDREFPRVFVGFGSHAIFNDQGGLKDVLSAYTDSEYRQADYPSWADQGGGLVEVALGSDLFRKFKDNAAAWGSATGNPAVVAENICSV